MRQPKLGQQFVIGAALDDIIVPTGATVLYLGLHDSAEWTNNSGTVEATITDIGPSDSVIEPGTGVAHRDFTVSISPESSTTYPIGKTWGASFTSVSIDPAGFFSGRGVNFEGVFEVGGSSEKLGTSFLVYRAKLDFGEAVELHSVAVTGAGDQLGDSIFRLLDENLNVIQTTALTGFNVLRTHTINVDDVTGSVFYVDEFDQSTVIRYRSDVDVVYTPITDEDVEPGQDVVAPGADLIAYWTFNDAADDAVARDSVAGYSGTVLGGATYTGDGGGRAGVSGDYALDFGVDRGGQTVHVENTGFLNTGTDTVTYSFWQKLAGSQQVPTDSASSFWVASLENSRGAQAHIPWPDGLIYFDTNGQERIVGRPPRLHDFSEWSHYALVKDGDRKQVWVNGTLAFEGTNTGDLPNSFTDLWIGSGFDGDFSLQGTLDDFAVFRSALSPEQIAHLANGQSPLRISKANFVDCDANGAVDPKDLECISTIGQRDAVLGFLESIPGDLDSDGNVTFDDFLVLANHFGEDVASYSHGNIDLLNGVDFNDFLILLKNFGIARQSDAVAESAKATAGL